MPPFLHFYPGFNRETYRRLPLGEWRRLVDYMTAFYKAGQSH